MGSQIVWFPGLARPILRGGVSIIRVSQSELAIGDLYLDKQLYSMKIVKFDMNSFTPSIPDTFK